MATPSITNVEAGLAGRLGADIILPDLLVDLVSCAPGDPIRS